ncbi:hypothetical protein E2C06_32470 [Dankookia rubra]|uniref:JmjC domain-containing protein n=1 Tax=Dankookia rubra TaxID=1442381 RepID=A0A4R5Q7C7_9PROT|nr:cupin-like domain-containing protein [Dankookia rubra]TDH58463.1 hypothetical protein E2C06_32470 [Dankookia rubra]
MSQKAILNWELQSLRDFGKVPVMLQHNLHHDELFSDTALERLFENIERRDYYVNTMNIASQDPRSRREGEIRDLSGAQVLEAVKNGQIWILLLRPHQAEPRYRQLLKNIYDEIAAKQRGFHSSFEKITVLISSPRIQVYYHCDIPGQTLWQVRGNKTVYVYPAEAPFLDRPTLENIALGKAHEISLPYNASFDDHAMVFDLQPGQMLHWPLNAPHRISNGDSMNVSFTTEHFTPAIRRMYHVNCANGILRSSLGINNPNQQLGGAVYWGKFFLSNAYRALRKSRMGTRRHLAVDFCVDPSSPRCVRDIPIYRIQE